jgi:hypothetical protein
MCDVDVHAMLGLLAPSVDTVARALAGRDRTRLQPAGAYAANALGLSEQVPAKAVFLTDGPSRSVKIGPTTIQLRRTTSRNMAAAGRLSGLLIQALLELGDTPAPRQHLMRTLPAQERRELVKDLEACPGLDASSFPGTGRSVKLEFGSLTEQRPGLFPGNVEPFRNTGLTGIEFAGIMNRSAECYQENQS